MKYFLLIVLPLFAAQQSLACELCRDAVSTSASSVSFNPSIYWMLGGLLGVMGFAGRAMYLAGRRL